MAEEHNQDVTSFKIILAISGFFMIGYYFEENFAIQSSAINFMFGTRLKHI